MPSPFSQARWVWSDSSSGSRFAVRRFRARVSVTQDTQAICHISADSRYILYCDGQLIGRGPARSDLRHYVYETYPLALSPGEHVVAAIVVAYDSEVGPIAEIHNQGAFLLELQDLDNSTLLATGKSDQWRVQADTAYQSAALTVRGAYYAIGHSESVNGSAIPHGWQQAEFDDSGWETPVSLCQPYLFERPMDLADPGGRWRLIPRDIPALLEEPTQFSSTPFPLTIPPHSLYETILETSAYTIGYPVVHTENGLGSTVRLTYAEALSKDGRKGIRDDREGTDVSGFFDTYICGGEAESYIPLHWRAFRFIKVSVQTGESPMTISSASYLRTGYPWERRAEFIVDDGPAEIASIQDLDFRTLECCTAETFMDCPYYEQLQYVGDTRLQALLSYVTTGDTRLGARAVRQFDWSRLPEGLTQSRYPSNLPQIIPPFSLIWILMVEDLWRYAPTESATVAECLPGCRGILEWFGRQTNADGLLDGKLPWWQFVDWADGWDHGVPPPAVAGVPSATLNLQYLAALQSFVRLHEELGDIREQEYWQAAADMLADSIMLAFWDPAAKLLREGPDANWGFTQHAQAWGLLTGIIPEGDVAAVAESLHSDENLTKATYYQTFYVVEALAKVGRLDRLWSHWLAPWRDALALHLTTWPEKPEPTRSDCHAWSAWPTYAFLTHVLGVKPVEGGFQGYAIDPKRVADWDVVSGKVATPAGLLNVSVTWTPDGKPRVSHRIER